MDYFIECCCVIKIFILRSHIALYRRHIYCILLLQGFQLLVCDWLLTTRSELWEHEMESGVVSSYQNLPGFRQDLNILQKLAGHMPGKIGRSVLNCSDDENIVIYVLLYSREL